MIEVIIKDYLSEKLGCSVLLEKTERPLDYPAVFFELTGSRGRYIRESTFAFQSYASSLYNACLLNDEVISAVQDMEELDEIVSVSLNSTYNYTDTTTKEYRYQAVFDIKHY